MDCNQPLGYSENSALKQLEPELKRHTDLTELAFNTIGEVMSILPDLTVNEISQSRKVATHRKP